MAQEPNLSTIEIHDMKSRTDLGNYSKANETRQPELLFQKQAQWSEIVCGGVD
jgi:hypothetical protein